MKYRTLFSILLSATTAHAFINLNFELAFTPSDDPDGSFYPDPNPVYLDWALAVPGWSNHFGNDIGVCYRPTCHAGSNPTYFLLEAPNNPDTPSVTLEGNYSLEFVSGDVYLPSPDPNDPFENSVYTHAFVSQEGTIPTGTSSIQLLARGTFQVFFDDNEIVMTEDEDSMNLWLGDISAYQGQTGELKIMESLPGEESYGTVILDDIRFIVPEPASYALFVSIGCLALLGSRHRTRRQRDIASQDF